MGRRDRRNSPDNIEKGGGPGKENYWKGLDESEIVLPLTGQFL